MAAHDVAALFGASMSWWFAGLLGVALAGAAAALAALVGR
jgi:hypothetical protein